MMFIFTALTRREAAKLWQFYNMERRITSRVWDRDVEDWDGINIHLDMAARMHDVQLGSSISVSNWLRYMNAPDRIVYIILRNVPHGLHMSGAAVSNDIIVVSKTPEYVLFDDGVNYWRDYAYPNLGSSRGRKNGA